MDKDEAKKKFIMKVGIISLMALILIFWILNIKNVFRGNEGMNADENIAQWQKIKEDFNETVDKMSVSLDKIQETNSNLNSASSSIINELLLAAVASSTASLATSSIPASYQDNASSSQIADESASTSTTVRNINCPEYIDCMPTIGEARPCQIPVGCEGITQIAY